MKTLCINSLFIIGWLLFLNSCHTSRPVAAAELVSENELKISEGFTAYSHYKKQQRDTGGGTEFTRHKADENERTRLAMCVW